MTWFSITHAGNPVAIFIGYACFATSTFAILLGMDVLGKLKLLQVQYPALV